MAIKVKVNLAGLKGFPRAVKKNFSKALKQDMADIIVEKILSGQSPVKNKRFPKYSPGYAKKKGRDAPVDLLVTGRMLESIRVKQNKVGSVLIFFKSKLAIVHDKTARKKRRLLPRGGETFSPDITKKLINILKKAVRKTLRRG